MIKCLRCNAAPPSRNCLHCEDCRVVLKRQADQAKRVNSGVRTTGKAAFWALGGQRRKGPPARN